MTTSIVPKYQRERDVVQANVMAQMADEVWSFTIAKGWEPDPNWKPDPAHPEITENPIKSAPFETQLLNLHSEITEAAHAFREAVGEGKELFQTYVIDHGGNPKPEGVGSELADVLIRLLHTAKWCGVDLHKEYRRKMRYNWTRAFRHGNKRI